MKLNTTPNKAATSRRLLIPKKASDAGLVCDRCGCWYGARGRRPGELCGDMAHDAPRWTRACKGRLR